MSSTRTGGVQMKVTLAISWGAFLILKSEGISLFISKENITSSRKNPSFRPGGDCDIWKCMTQNSQGVEMSGAEDSQGPVTKIRFWFIQGCSQLCYFCVSLACDGGLWQNWRKNKVGMGTQGLVRQIWGKKTKWKTDILSRPYPTRDLANTAKLWEPGKVKFIFWLHCCLTGCLSLPICNLR